MNTEHGYVSDVTYPPHFHKEMQPVWLASLAHIQGTPAPRLDKPYTYCELGCATGINLLVAAACNPLGQFVGVDLNEQHLDFARQAARRIGLENVRFVHGDFRLFARDNEQTFDFIASHGVWSWIAPQQQEQVLGLIRRSLNPRGLLYLHYMCHPGASQMVAVQKLLNELAAHLSGSSEDKIRIGIDLLWRLDASGVFHDQPRLSANVKALRTMNTAYLAHHFLSDHWAPQHSVDVHRALAGAGVSYLGSANVLDNLDGLSVPGATQPLLQGLPSPAIREMIKDMARSQHQRQDLFQRDPVRLPAAQHLHLVDAMRFRLAPGAANSGSMQFKTPIGDIQGPAETFSPLLERLTAAPASFAQLRQLAPFSHNIGLLSQSLQMLMWQGSVHPLRPDTTPCIPAAARLQAWLTDNGLQLEVLGDCGSAAHRPQR